MDTNVQLHIEVNFDQMFFIEYWYLCLRLKPRKVKRKKSGYRLLHGRNAKYAILWISLVAFVSGSSSPCLRPCNTFQCVTELYTILVVFV